MSLYYIHNDVASQEMIILYFRCTWNVEAVDDFGNTDLKSSLVIESFNIPQILCENGRFIVYDGECCFLNIRDLILYETIYKREYMKETLYFFIYLKEKMQW